DGSLKDLFKVESPSESEESEPEDVKPDIKPASNAVIEFLKEQRHIIPDRVAQKDQCRKVTEKQALTGRREALELQEKNDKAELLKKKESIILTMLEEYKQQLPPDADLPTYLERFKAIAIEQIRVPENAWMMSIGSDLYIMTGMLLGLFRADEDSRVWKVANFEKHNFHKDAEGFLMREKQLLFDERQTQKRKADDEEKEYRDMMEEEEDRRYDEELDEQNEREVERILDQSYYDVAKYHQLIYDRYSHDEAHKKCLEAARVLRIFSRMEIEPVSSPPRSVADLNDIAVNLENIKLEEEYHVYNPRHVPEAHFNPTTIFSEEELAQARVDYGTSQDVDMEDLSENRGADPAEYGVPDGHPVQDRVKREVDSPKSSSSDESYDPSEVAAAAAAAAAREMRESSDEYDPADAAAAYEADLAEEQRLRDRLLERARQREEDRQRDALRDEVAAFAAAEQRRRDDEIARKEWEEYERKKAAHAAAIARREERETTERLRQAAAALAAVEEQRRFEENRRAAAAAAAERAESAARDRALAAAVEQAQAEFRRVAEETDRRTQAYEAEREAREAQCRDAANAQQMQYWQQQQMHHHQQPYLQQPYPLALQQPYPRQQQHHYDPQLQHPQSAQHLQHHRPPPLMQQRRQPHPLAHEPHPHQHLQEPPLQHEPPTGYRTPGRDPDEYPEIEPIPEIVIDDEMEEEEREFPMETVWKYKQPLSREEMAKMIDERVKRERKKKPALLRVTCCGQGESGTDGVPLGCFKGSAVDDTKKIRADYGIRPKGGIKSIFKHKSMNSIIPVILTDLHAEKLDFSGIPKGALLQEKLVNLQKSFSFHPRKQVKFLEGDDPKHKLRGYTMQAEQQWLLPPFQCDFFDDGYDMVWGDGPMTVLKEVLELAAKKEREGALEEFKSCSTLQRRFAAGDVHANGGQKRMKQRGRLLCYHEAGTTVPVSKKQDVIFTRASARNFDARKEGAKEFTVSHRDYKIMLAMRPMSDQIIQYKWLYTLRMYATYAFGCELHPHLGTSVANSGLSHLIFADSLLDRVNTFRFPQSYFIIHQKPLTLSSSFRMLCNHIPFEKLVQIEWFIFAYGFDEIVFMGKEPKVAAESLIHHVLAIMRLYFSALTHLQKTHRLTHQPKFRVFKLPPEGMDKRIQPWIKQFNDHLGGLGKAMAMTAARANRTAMMPMMFVVLDWETPAIMKAAVQVGKSQVDERNDYAEYKRSLLSPADQEKAGELEYLEYRYHCMDSFVQSTNAHCEMRTSRIYRDNRAAEYHRSRTMARVHGLSEDEKNRYY
ncbi:hypothetical protein PENTCL1PPCAC_4554, partial [Pristionchus entomophagus]